MLRLLALPSIPMLCSLSLQGCSPLALRCRAPAAAQQHRCCHHHGAPLPLHVWTAGTAWLKPVAVAAAAKTKGKQQGATIASTTVNLSAQSQAAAAAQRGPPCVIVAVDPGEPPCIHQWHNLRNLAHRSVQTPCPTDGTHSMPMQLPTPGMLPCHGPVPMPVIWRSRSHPAHAALGGCRP